MYSDIKVVLSNPDIKAMCSLTKCKHSKFAEDLLYCQPTLPNLTVINSMVNGPIAMHYYS